MGIEHNKESQCDPDDIDIRLQHFRLGHIIYMVESKKLAIYDDDSRGIVNTWTQEQKSLFIESLLVRLPVPTFYFDGSNSHWKVIDGLQRLRTVYEFIQNKFRLTSLEYFHDDCENCLYKELPGYLQDRIPEMEIIAYVINPGTPQKVRYDVFRRISGTATRLNGQEIRYIFFHGQASDFVKKVSALPLFSSLSKEKIGLERMEAFEYVNRFVAFLYVLNTYDGDMDDFLYKGMCILDEAGSKQLDHTENAFVKGLEHSQQLFGEHIFQRPLPDGSWSECWSKSVFDVCMYNMQKLNGQQMHALLEHKESFLSDFQEKFSMNGEWSRIYSSDDRQSVIQRFDEFRLLLLNTVGCDEV